MFKQAEKQRLMMARSSSSGGSGGACYIYPDAPATPGIVTPDVVYDRGIYMKGSMTMDDGTVVPIWGFTDGFTGGMNSSGPFPSPPMRVNAGTIVHTRLNVSGMMWKHTIHHHGIEPADHADGVGHITWDVDGLYTYQWRPMHPGTYFYHCHTNTVLHAEMGMYGALIVDPPEGPGTLLSGGPTYDMEAFWVVDEIDSRWHNLPWDAGTCGADVGLNVLNPDYFVITGVDASGDTAINGPAVIAPVINVGQRLLVRYICAGYHPQHVRFGGLNVELVQSDARPLPESVMVTELEAVSAERYDIIVAPTQPGEHLIEIDIKHWITGAVLGTARTRITVV